MWTNTHTGSMLNGCINYRPTCYLIRHITWQFPQKRHAILLDHAAGAFKQPEARCVWWIYFVLSLLVCVCFEHRFCLECDTLRMMRTCLQCLHTCGACHAIRMFFPHLTQCVRTCIYMLTYMFCVLTNAWHTHTQSLSLCIIMHTYTHSHTYITTYIHICTDIIYIYILKTNDTHTHDTSVSTKNHECLLVSIIPTCA